jgi:hypothetical protein
MVCALLSFAAIALARAAAAGSMFGVAACTGALMASTAINRQDALFKDMRYRFMRWRIGGVLTGFWSQRFAGVTSALQ